MIVQAGQSELGRDLAAKTAEVVFTVQQDLNEARAFYADIKRRAGSYGREPQLIKVMPGLLAVVGESRNAAEEKLARIQALVHPELGLSRLSGMVGIDLSGYPEDGPLPHLAPSLEQQGRQKVVIDLARRENLTIR